MSCFHLQNSRFLPRLPENESVLGEKHIHFHPHRKKETCRETRSGDDWEFAPTYYAGTFCEVKKARPAGRNVPYSYAVKQLKSRWLGTRLGDAVLQREYELGQLVSHQHIVPTLSANFDTDFPYLVQPWLEGKTIHEFLTLGRRATLQETIWIARQIADALMTLEKHHYCHSDLKPGNIIVSPTGHATLIDLGLAHRFDEPCSLIDRSVCGTPSYMAPECFLPCQNIDIRADIYSLGMVLVEMLAGASPLCQMNFGEKCDHLSPEYATPKKMLQQECLEGKPGGGNSVMENIKTSRAEMVEKMFGNMDYSCTSEKFGLLLNAMIAEDMNDRPDSASGLFRRLIDLELSLITSI
ncbi:MAG: protein kinase [Planctomycetaceae bacterium]|nr:protein kinase [Planctomycetaceae bacterium]